MCEASDRGFPQTFQFQRKWKHLRDGFSRELAKQKQEKSGSLCSARKKYVYFDHLLFLLRVMQGKYTVFDLDDENHQKVDESYSGDNATLRPLVKKRKTSFPSEETILHSPKDTTQFRCKSPVDESDADRLFMLSFVKELKQVPEEFKLEVKSDIINVFRKAKLYNSSKSTTTSSV
ncbi:uncharacterized protein LOC129216115 [Uloborus diversus]|uniref:uncharacterized protein LOC129216115 n=1 Tax=Uloborus diversus TaxID=327109 RepID=UPI00240A4666|nr:uncharacterized protein LOC129216115 [Uloborus diversus]